MYSEMAPVNNTIDKFGRSKSSNRAVVIRGPPGAGFALTKDGNYDIQGKVMKNVGKPIDSQDGATRSYVDEYVNKFVEESSNALNVSSDKIIKGLKKYVNSTKSALKQEYQTNLDKRVNELVEQLHKYVEVKKLEIEKSFNDEISERIEEVIDRLRIYVNGQIDQFEDKNISTKRQLDIVVERMNAIENDLKEIFGKMIG